MFLERLRIYLGCNLRVQPHVESIIIHIIHQRVRRTLNLGHSNVGAHKFTKLLDAPFIQLNVIKPTKVELYIRHAIAAIGHCRCYSTGGTLSKQLFGRLALLLYRLLILLYIVHDLNPYASYSSSY